MGWNHGGQHGVLRRRLHLPSRALPHELAAAVRELLPLHLVPARDRRVVCAQRHDQADRVELIAGAPEVVDTPSASGRGQKISRCPQCRVALWSNYSGAGDAVRFVRVGTLDAGHGIGPDIHIFTTTKQPWVVIPPDAKAVPEFYKPAEMWPKESLERRAAIKK